MAFLPRRALYLLAEYLGIKLNGKTCRAHTSKGKICKHKRPNGQLFCAQHTKSYSIKVGIQKSLHICRGSQMKFGEYLAIFGETIKTQNLRYVSQKERPRLDHWSDGPIQENTASSDRSVSMAHLQEALKLCAAHLAQLSGGR